MGLSKALFTNVARTAFSIAGEAVKAATYHQDGVPDRAYTRPKP